MRLDVGGGLSVVRVDREFIIDYLLRKINNQALPIKILETYVYSGHPSSVTANHPQIVEGEWLFFSPRDHRRSHYRRSRENGNGEWKWKHKLTLRDEVGEIGVKNPFYYREGLPPAPTTNTSWQMAKYVLNGARTQSPNHFVLSIIYRNTQRGPSNNAVVDCSVGTSQTSSQLRIGETENLAQPPPWVSESEGVGY
ncbi:unnamed protein product [Lactuca saligna]|uniref:NAC domain-containing protein n=1 Tax=Lactuca saligna TaxID=75948 RepID=A0AA35Y934_LACSI|nr:unnamed protein product [Lactuca saligna]